MQVKGVIEEENNLFVLLHDNEVWVKATAGNVVKELFAKGPTSLATLSMLSGPPHDVYLVSF